MNCSVIIANFFQVVSNVIVLVLFVNVRLFPNNSRKNTFSTSDCSPGSKNAYCYLF